MVKNSLDKPIRASEIARKLKSPLIGKDILIRSIRSLFDPSEWCVTFCNEKKPAQALKLLTVLPKSVAVICSNALPARSLKKMTDQCFIPVRNPRLSMIRLMNDLKQPKENSVHPTAMISKKAKIGKNAMIGAYSVIEDGVTIGSDCRIGNYVKISRNTVVGNHVSIQSSVVIGEDGLGFEFENGTWIEFPHIGKVLIGDHVFIGTHTTIFRGNLSDTVLENHVKIGSHSVIGHNAHMGKNTLAAPSVRIGGGAQIGPGCWIGINAIIRDRIKIGRNALIGMGSVVVKSVPENKVVFGSPAKVIRKNKLLRV